jgi:hypothetical protein
MRLALGQRAAMIMNVISALSEIYKQLERMWRMFPEPLDEPVVEWKQPASSWAIYLPENPTVLLTRETATGKVPQQIIGQHKLFDVLGSDVRHGLAVGCKVRMCGVTTCNQSSCSSRARHKLPLIG